MVQPDLKHLNREDYVHEKKKGEERKMINPKNATRGASTPIQK